MSDVVQGNPRVEHGSCNVSTETTYVRTVLMQMPMRPAQLDVTEITVAAHSTVHSHPARRIRSVGGRT